MSKEQPVRSHYEELLLRAMRAIDNQIAREMQRTPAELEEQGVKKWEPMEKRAELTVSTVLDSLGENEIQVESVLVIAQALCKVILLVSEDLGADGLGKVRAEYFREAIKKIARDMQHGEKALQESDALN
jgi:hypothetical protein